MTMSKPLHIAMIGQRGLPATFGGVERHVEEIGARLAARGHRVDVYCRPHYSQDVTLGPTHRGMHRIEVNSMTSAHLEAFSHSGASTWAALRSKANVFHYHAIGPGVWSFAPRLKGRNVAVTQTIHGLDFERDKWSRPAQGLIKAIARASAHVPHLTIGVSQTLVQEYQDRFRRQITYIPNGVVTPELLAPGPALKRLGLTPRKYALFVGRIVPEKAVAPLVEAFDSAPDDFQLVVAGGSSHTDEYTQQVRTLAERNDRVHLPGYLYGDELREVYSNAAIFVLPSLLEGLPLTLLEAISYRLPVVASDIGAHREILGSSSSGHRMFPSGDWKQLGLQLHTALANVDRETEDAAEHATLLREYDWDLVTDQVEAEYYRLVERP